MKETKKQQDVKRPVSDIIMPQHKLTQVQMQLSKSQKATYFYVPQFHHL